MYYTWLKLCSWGGRGGGRVPARQVPYRLNHIIHIMSIYLIILYYSFLKKEVRRCLVELCALEKRLNEEKEEISFRERKTKQKSFSSLLYQTV